MNIGEISKPIADAKELKANAVKVNATNAIEPVVLLGEQVDISVKAKERFKQFQEKKRSTQQKSAPKPNNEKINEKEERLNDSVTHIDIIA